MSHLNQPTKLVTRKIIVFPQLLYGNLTLQRLNEKHKIISPSLRITPTFIVNWGLAGTTICGRGAGGTTTVVCIFSFYLI